MIAAILTLLSTRWVQYALGSLAVVAALWFGVINPYNNYITNEAVSTALAKERAKTELVFKELAASFNNLTAQINQRIADTNAATDKKLREVKNEADRKTKQYRDELATQKVVSDQFRADSRIELDSLRESTKTLAASNGSCGADTGNSGYANGLANRFASCARALSEAEDDLAEQLERAEQAETAIRALTK